MQNTYYLIKAAQERNKQIPQLKRILGSPLAAFNEAKSLDPGNRELQQMTVEDFRNRISAKLELVKQGALNPPNIHSFQFTNLAYAPLSSRLAVIEGDSKLFIVDLSNPSKAPRDIMMREITGRQLSQRLLPELQPDVPNQFKRKRESHENDQ